MKISMSSYWQSYDNVMKSSQTLKYEEMHRRNDGTHEVAFNNFRFSLRKVTRKTFAFSPASIPEY